LDTCEGESLSQSSGLVWLMLITRGGVQVVTQTIVILRSKRKIVWGCGACQVSGSALRVSYGADERTVLGSLSFWPATFVVEENRIPSSAKGGYGLCSSRPARRYNELSYRRRSKHDTRIAPWNCSAAAESGVSFGSDVRLVSSEACHVPQAM
jgi:hypothetical protein